MEQKKFFIADLIFEKEYIDSSENYNLKIDEFKLGKDITEKEIFANYNVLYFDYATDLISTKLTPSSFEGTFILSNHFNPKSEFDFKKHFPSLKGIVCENHETYLYLSKKYQHSNLKISFKPSEVNYC